MRSLRLFLSILTFALAGSANADLAVVATGDSLTSGYAPNLQIALANHGVTAQVTKVGAGGLSAPVYIGEAPLISGQDLHNYANDVLAADPDVVLFMLGTNDVWGNLSADTRFADYSRIVTDVIDQFTSYTNGRGNNAHVFISTVLPFDLAKNQAYWNTTSNSGALDRIENWYNPLITDLSSNPGVTLVDNWTAIQNEQDWKERLLADHDGLHLSPDGYEWLADQFAGSVAATSVPEPSTLLLACIALLCAVVIRKRRVS